MTQTETIPAAEPAKPEALLLEVVTKNKIAGPDLVVLQTTFSPMLAEVEKWAAMARMIKITDATQTREMKLAKDTRLALREIRVNADKKRIALKANAMRYGRAVDGAYAIVEFITKETEAHLLEQEKFAERLEEQRVAKLKLEREELLKPYNVDTSLYQLGLMPPDAFASLLEGQQLAFENRQAQARKAEQDRLEADNRRLIEEKRVRDENARLLQEKADREAADKAAREKADREAAAAAEARIAAVTTRQEALAPYKVDTAFLDLGAMTDEKFAELLQASKDGFAAAEQKRKDDEAKAAADRAEQLRLQAEARVKKERTDALTAERLKEIQAFAFGERPFETFGEMTPEAWAAALQHAATTHQAEVARRAKAEEERLAAKADADKAALQASKDRAAREKAEKELADARKVEADHAARLQAEAIKAATAPDKEKLLKIAAGMRALEIPEMTTPDAKAVADTLRAQANKFAAWIEAQAAKL